jgi:hypothetical protein
MSIGPQRENRILSQPANHGRGRHKAGSLTLRPMSGISETRPNIVQILKRNAKFDSSSANALYVVCTHAVQSCQMGKLILFENRCRVYSTNLSLLRNYGLQKQFPSYVWLSDEPKSGPKLNSAQSPNSLIPYARLCRALT